MSIADSSSSKQPTKNEEVSNAATSLVARNSLVWNIAFHLFWDVAQLVQAVILARLISPEAYGQFAFATSCIGFISIFTLKNFSTYTLQVKHDNDAHFQDHFTSGVVFQVGAFFLANLLAISMRFFPDGQGLALPIHVMSLKFLIDWPTEIRCRMLERSHAWKRRRLLNAAGILLSLGVAIAMAFAGMGVYALVIPGMLVPIPFIFDLFVSARFRPTWHWSWENYQDAFQFGVTRLGAGASTAGRQLMENSVFASSLGFASLGMVNRAVGLSQLTCGRIASQIIQAIYPILTRLESRSGKAALAGDLLMQAISWATWPLACATGVLALPAIATVYGSQWHEAADIIAWPLAWTVVMALMQVAYSLLLARQQAKLCLWGDFGVLAGTVACLFLLLPQGIGYYFAGLTITYAATLCVLAYFLLQFSAMTKRGLWNAIAPPVVACILATAATTALLSSKAFEGTEFLPAAMWGGTFLMLYVACLRILFAGPLKTLVAYFPARKQVARVLCLSGD